jgi:hypothetical protein
VLAGELQIRLNRDERLVAAGSSKCRSSSFPVCTRRRWRVDDRGGMLLSIKGWFGADWGWPVTDKGYGGMIGNPVYKLTTNGLSQAQDGRESSSLTWLIAV